MYKLFGETPLMAFFLLFNDVTLCWLHKVLLIKNCSIMSEDKHNYLCHHSLNIDFQS